MADIVQVPVPETLDPDRANSDDREDMTLMEHRSRAQQLDAALHASCAYGQALWHQLDALRHYLIDTLPDDPTSEGAVRTVTAPTGPDDEAGWQRWTEAYASTTSALAGPHGDSGFGLDEARLTARNRRLRPVPGKDVPGEDVPGTDERGEDARRGGTPAGGGSAGATRQAQHAADGRIDRIRWGVEAVLFVLALRGLRSRSTTG